MKWRVLPYSKGSAAVNMAVDEAVSEAVRDGRSRPTIRFYGWAPSAVSIGCFQAIDDVVDVDACRERGIDIVRRRTGGGAVYHDSKGEITYAVIAPEGMFEKDIPASYREVCGWAMAALSDLGLSPSYAPINDILVSGKKISGCAQTRREGVFLQHGTVLHSLDMDTMFSVLRVDQEKISDKGLSSARDRVTSVSALTAADKRDLLASLQRSFCAGKEWSEMPLSPEERTRATALARDRYGDRGWTFSR